MTEEKETYSLEDLAPDATTISQVSPPALLSVFGDPVTHSLSPQLHNPALQALNIDAKSVEANLFADLKENHCLTDFDSIDAERLVGVYEMSQRQAVLLRAVHVLVKLRPTNPASLRLFFRRLKFELN